MAASGGAHVFAAGYHPITRRSTFATTRRVMRPLCASVTTSQDVNEEQKRMPIVDQSLRTRPAHELTRRNRVKSDSQSEMEHPSLKDYLEQSKELIARSDGGPPRWFSPLECGSRSNGSPLLLYLPGIGAVGLGLMLQHQKLGEIFDIWCLHIPVMDRTAFIDLVKLVEETVKSENYRTSRRPIYLVGESFGGCIALAVAARNPDLDLMLILANPATSFHKSQLQSVASLLGVLPEQFQLDPSLLYTMFLMSGFPSRMVVATAEKQLPLQRMAEEINQDATAFLSYVSVLADLLTVETILWKWKMLKSAEAFANSRLHAVKARTLLLCSGNDQLLPSEAEGKRLKNILQNCEIRTFSNSSHVLFLENDFDLVGVIKGASFYRRGSHLDYVSDFLPPRHSEFMKHYTPYRWTEVALNPVMLSTLENGKIVRGLSGIPSEGPVLFVGYHMMIGVELVPLVSRFWTERRIVLRGMAHPMMFNKKSDGRLLPDLSTYDSFRFMGAVPVSAANLYKLLSSKSHVLLYPGGMREALHRKGEEYKLFWPEQSEFVRMAARFGAKIIPFGAVGEDDISQLLLDYDDLMKIPYFKAGIEELTSEAVKLRSDSVGEVANQDVHLPIFLPKVPGRFYYFFGKPIETEGKTKELKNREKAHEIYLEVKTEVEKCIAYLRENRKKDPYRSIMARLMYQAINGFDTEVPTFEL